MEFFLLVVAAFIVFLAYFNRTPTRVVPRSSVIVSPANGKVIAIGRAETEKIIFFKEGIQNELEAYGVTLPAHVVVISMNLQNVHVQRAPIDGVVTCIEHQKGKFKNAIYGKHTTELVNANEKNLIVISNVDETIAVIQVAGFLARRIKSYVKEDQEILQGSKIGFIALGSQVVLVIPESRILEVKIGDTLIDGETVVAK
jgi:phosphatidylserine decarboxylase